MNSHALKELHSELGTAVARAYGWTPGLPEEDLLQKLVDLNAERRAEEEEGHVRYVRPDRAIADCKGGSGFRPRPAYQAPETVETQAALELGGPESRPLSGDGAPAEPLDWPSALTDS